MKALKLVTLILLTLSNMTFQACAKDKNGHTLTKLWAEYEKAVDADKPKDQADILERIKKEATVQKLPWDFYDASWKYVQATRTSRSSASPSPSFTTGRTGDPPRNSSSPMSRNRRNGCSRRKTPNSGMWTATSTGTHSPTS